MQESGNRRSGIELLDVRSISTRVELAEEFETTSKMYSSTPEVKITHPLDIPLGVRVVSSLNCNYQQHITKLNLYKYLVLVVTYIAYASYHLSRRPSTIVRSVLNRNCSELGPTVPGNETWCDWKPFDQPNYQGLFGTLDYAYLFAYAIGMFVSGHVAERMHLRSFLSGGMILCCITTCAFGGGYFWDIHSFSYFVFVQVAAGLVQSTGWPAVCAAVANWVGKGKRGFITGVWNSHTFLGNIIGSLVAGAFVDQWGWSFIVPGLMIGVAGIIVYLFLVPHPSDVGLPPTAASDGGLAEARALMRQSGIDIRAQREALESSAVVNVDNEQDRSRDITASTSTLTSTTSEIHMDHRSHSPISLASALCIPGVAEYSACLFFVKLVSYTFLFWLPNYITNTTSYDATESAWLSTLNDLGGIVGSILIGIAADRTGRPGICSLVVLVISCPTMWIYHEYGNQSLGMSITLLFILGLFINGPYTLITTAVAQDLGEHRVLRGNTKAIATVTAIIDGTGSIGAAVGPLLTGWIASSGWQNVFYMLIASDVLAALVSLYIVLRHERERSRAEVEKENERASRRPSESSQLCDDTKQCSSLGMRSVRRAFERANRPAVLCTALVVVMLVCYLLFASGSQPTA